MQALRRSTVLKAAGIAVIIVLAGGILYAAKFKAPAQPTAPTYTADALSKLPRYDKSGIDISHVAKGVTPPTNRWFSGIALQAKAQPVFPLPLKFTPSNTGFTFDLPKVQVGAKLIQAADNAPVEILIKGADHYFVTRYDAASVDVTYYASDNSELATATVTAGSPYIFVESKKDTTLTTKTAFMQNGSALQYVQNDTMIGIAPYGGAVAKSGGDTITVTAPKDGYVALFAGPSKSSWNQLVQNAENRIVGTSVEYAKSGNDYTTTIAYDTANKKPTWFARLPHQGDGGDGPVYDTIYGRINLQQGTKLEYKTAAVQLKQQLGVDALNADQKQLLITTLNSDTSQLTGYPDDTYFGGKMLYRDAQFLQLAKQLGQNTVADKMQTRLHTALTKWLTPNSGAPQSFYYDTLVHGVVGVTPAFGSEEFNDHHFHYGYFIYAASVLAQYDNAFKSQYQPRVNILIADIANNGADSNFPMDRMYDAYFGHSWASGSAPFADGNNQESTSEAINAWIGMGLWATQIGNTNMATQAGWLLSNETAAAGAYWLNFNTAEYPYNAGFNEQIIALNWGGKRDYATFFSASPKAMLGIQLLPMSPTTAGYLGGYNGIAKQLQQARSGQAAGEQFDDYLLMYEALQGNGSKLLDQAKALPDTAIDGANSRTYLYAWLLTRT